MKTRNLIITGVLIIGIISVGLLSYFLLLDNTYENASTGSVFPPPPLDHVLIASLENDFDYDSLSFKEKSRNSKFAKTLLVSENDLKQFPSLLSAINDVGRYDSFPNKGYSNISEEERRLFKEFRIKTSEEQTGIANSSYYSLEFQGNVYHIDYNFRHPPADDLFLYVYVMDPKDPTDLFVKIEEKDFANIPIIGEVLIKKQFLSDDHVPEEVSVKDQILYQDYLDSKFEEKYGVGTAPFGINHILFADENSNEFRLVVQFERIY
ncbi:hypothetical protein [Nitrosopumilus sp.]|uniref:hypothetical protein n=1 Tax=Nitrosopumilus sp. TaxID=2024843 RepID=UPI0034A06FB0